MKKRDERIQVTEEMYVRAESGRYSKDERAVESFFTPYYNTVRINFIVSLVLSMMKRV